MDKNQLIIDIARCNEIERARTNDDHPCHKIVTSRSQDNFHVPEPWNGNISTATILFISSNPNANPKEDFPTNDWSDKHIIDFFTDRFKHVPKKDYPTYWKSILKWASWLLPDVPQNELLDHIACTEVAHCKSVSENGVKGCSCYCTQKWFDKVLEQFNGNYIVVVGNTAKFCFGVRNVNAQVIFTPASRWQSNTERQEIFSECARKNKN